MSTGLVKKAAEPMLNQATKQVQSANGPRFGAGIDPIEAGRRGGIASGVSRRTRPFRELEERIASTKNGAAIFGLYRTRLEREQALDAERIRLDSFVHRLITEADGLEQTIEDLRDEVDRLRNARHALFVRVTALEQREQELKAAVASDASLATLLRHAGEERTERALREIGWLDEDSDAA